MIRILAAALVGLIANGVALVVGAVVLPDFSLGYSGFIIAVAIFTVTGLLIEPLVRQVAFKQVPALVGSTALISTLVGLVVTALLTDNLSIQGTTTWIAAVVVVWLAALVARQLLPLVIFQNVLAARRA